MWMQLQLQSPPCCQSGQQSRKIAIARNKLRQQSNCFNCWLICRYQINRWYQMAFLPEYDILSICHQNDIYFNVHSLWEHSRLLHQTMSYLKKLSYVLVAYTAVMARTVSAWLSDIHSFPETIFIIRMMYHQFFAKCGTNMLIDSHS